MADHTIDDGGYLILNCSLLRYVTSLAGYSGAHGLTAGTTHTTCSRSFFPSTYLSGIHAFGLGQVKKNP